MTIEDYARRNVAAGLERGYDCRDDGTLPPARDWAHIAARAVLADLNDRSGIKFAFDNIDEAVRVEIVETLAETIRYAFSARGTENS